MFIRSVSVRWHPFLENDSGKFGNLDFCFRKVCGYNHLLSM